MPSTVTFTGPLGPGRSVSSRVFSDVVSAEFDFDGKTLTITQREAGLVTVVDIAATTTITATASAGNYTITVSQ